MTLPRQTCDRSTNWTLLLFPSFALRAGPRNPWRNTASTACKRVRPPPGCTEPARLTEASAERRLFLRTHGTLSAYPRQGPLSRPDTARGQKAAGPLRLAVNMLPISLAMTGWWPLETQSQGFQRNFQTDVHGNRSCFFPNDFSPRHCTISGSRAAHPSGTPAVCLSMVTGSLVNRESFGRNLLGLLLSR